MRLSVLAAQGLGRPILIMEKVLAEFVGEKANTKR